MVKYITSRAATQITPGATARRSWGSGPTDPDQWSDTVYAYRAGNGDILKPDLIAPGQDILAGKQRDGGAREDEGKIEREGCRALAKRARR